MEVSREEPWRILAIDDDPDILALYQDMLGRCGREEIEQELSAFDRLLGQSESEHPYFLLDTELSGKVALERIQQALEVGNPYAVVMIDLHMPGDWDGVMTAERIRAMDREVRIIFITGFLDISLTSIRQRLGVDFDFLTKPIHQDEFVQLVISLSANWESCKALRKAKQEQERYREQLTASLALEKEHTELILETMREGVVVVDRFGNIQEINPKMERLLGKSEEEVAGRPFSELFVLKAGERKTIDNLSQARAEIQRLFEYNEASLARKIDRSVLALLLVDERGSIQLANHAMEELSGWRVDQLIGRSMEVLIPRQWRSRHERLFQQFISLPTARKMGSADRLFPLLQADGADCEIEIALLPVRLEGKLKVVVLLHDPVEVQKLEIFKFSPLGSLFVDRKKDEGISAEWDLSYQDNEVIPVHVSGSPIYREVEGGRRFNGVVLVVRDQRSMLKAKYAIKANQAKDEFLASMSHELRTPLASIIGNCELLSEQIWDQVSAEQQDMLRAIEVSGRAQLALVNDILDLSKISAGKFEVDEIDYDLNTMVQEVSDIFAMKATSAGLSFQVIVPDHLTHQVVGDGRRTAQILINLLGNAVKFTERGSIILKVAIIDGAWIEFSVADQGIGMSPEVVERLFQPFEQADNSISRRYGGTGLGLHISWSLAELMGGRIEVESEEGVGSRFTLYLPYRVSRLPVYLQQNHRRERVDLFFRGKVLLVDDLEDLRVLGRRMLEVMGVEVDTAANGHEAVEKGLQQRYDLILMDMQMPLMDGITATSTLRSLSYHGPIYALTANVMASHRQQFAEAGCDGLLGKPIVRTELVKVLKSCLEQRDKDEVDQALQQQDPSLLIDDELISKFTERVGFFLQEMVEAVAVEDWKQINATAHTVKGCGSSYGYHGLTKLGKAICDALHDGDRQTAIRHVRSLVTELERISFS